LSVPDPKAYLPVISEKSLMDKQLLFHQNNKRKSLFTDKLFVVMLAPQFERIKDVVQYAGGRVILKQAKDEKLVNGLQTSSQMLVVQTEKKDEKNLTPIQMKWMKEMNRKVESLNLRLIRESEIGLAILDISLEKHCNPTLSSAAAIVGNTHTQVIQDSMYVPTQPSQFLTKNLHTEQQSVFEDVTQDLHLHDKVGKNQIADPNDPLTSLNENGKRRLTSVDNNSEIQNEACTNKKPKCKELCDEEMKSKLDVADSIMDREETDTVIIITEEEKKPKTSQNNIIDIEDDDDEDDVFSLNFSKSSLPTNFTSTAKSKTDESSKDKKTDFAKPCKPFKFTSTSETVTNESAEYDKNNGPVPQRKELDQDVESAALFTACSRKNAPSTFHTSGNTSVPACLTAETPSSEVLNKSSVPETWFAAVTPASNVMNKSRVSDTCPSVLRKYTSTEDDDSDDDPFSFSINTKSFKRTTDRNKGGIMHEKSSSKDENHLVSDSDTSLNQTDDEKQQSRHIKGASSSQCSEPDDVLVSDKEGNLIPKGPVEHKQKHSAVTGAVTSIKESISDLKKSSDDVDEVDMSHMLDDGCDDFIGNIDPSKEYNPENQATKRTVATTISMNGWLSAENTRPKFNRDMEDPDLIGIDTKNMGKVQVMQLVVEPKPIKHVSADTQRHGSTSKCFKLFRKQQVSSHPVNYITVKVYEGRSTERETIFAEIRERDAMEAEENRRIDEMFEPVITKKKR